MSNQLTSQIVPVGDRFKTWLSGETSELNLNSFDWHRHMRDNPSYPANPRTACPRGFIRLDQAGHTAAPDGATLGCATAGFVYQFSLWLQYRQTPGQQHQRLLALGIDVIHTAILREDLDLSAPLAREGLFDWTRRAILRPRTARPWGALPPVLCISFPSGCNTAKRQDSNTKDSWLWGLT